MKLGSRQGAPVALCLTVLLVGLGSCGTAAEAHPLEWRLEQPSPPALVAGEAPRTPIGLGRVGDIEFWAPNRGLLITDGDPPTIPAGLWAYDGEGWHELATVCGATDGRIAWAGPEEFWTISDGRPGQAANPQNGEPAPLADDTLCHFAGGQVVTSYASLAFQSTSYQPMHAAACAGPLDCWFGGDPLPEPQVGAFHLHWDGGSLIAEAGPQGHAVEDMQAFEGRLFESVRLSPGDRLTEAESAEHPSILHELTGGSSPFSPLLPRSPLTAAIVPAYGEEEFPEALDALHLSADEEALWGAAGPVKEPPSGSKRAAGTVLRYTHDPETDELSGTELIGAETTPSGSELFGRDVVSAIAADPSSGGAYLGLDSQGDVEKPSPSEHALLAHLTTGGTTSEVLPSATQEAEGIGPKGAAGKLVCPAENDCWMVTTQGWLFHLSEGEVLARDEDPAFAGLITYRPPDEGIPQVPPDAPPVDDSGLLGEIPFAFGALPEEKKTAPESRVTVALLSSVHSRLVRGSMLELRFHLAARARVRLIAKRHGRVVGATASKTFAAGNRRLLLRLDRRRWPTSLKLEEHALAPLPSVAVHTEGPIAANTVSTSFRPRSGISALTGTDQLP